LKAAIAEVLRCGRQRCTMPLLNHCVGHARKDRHGLLAALAHRVFNADDEAEARRALSGRRVTSSDGCPRSGRCSRAPLDLRRSDSPSSQPDDPATDEEAMVLDAAEPPTHLNAETGRART
jgi:transposase-like protein